jgi:hypothetical protein
MRADHGPCAHCLPTLLADLAALARPWLGFLLLPHVIRLRRLYFMGVVDEKGQRANLAGV